MACIVQKFGGTSLGSLTRLQSAAKRVIAARQRGDVVVVVVSAMAGETNRLTYLAQQLAISPSSRECAALLSTGEQVAMNLMTLYLIEQGVNAVSYSGLQIPIYTSDDYQNAQVVRVETARIRDALAREQVVVVAGFQGVNKAGDITTLGRGGSDVTAVAIAAAIDADECQIFTDVDGVYTADPRLVPKARLFEVLCYQQLLALTAFGAKVVQSRAVDLAVLDNVPLRVLSSFSEKGNTGTLITSSSMLGEATLPSLSLTYQMIDGDCDKVEISVVGINNNKISKLSQTIQQSIEKLNCQYYDFQCVSDRVFVVVALSALARCLCVLHSQLALDDK